MKFHELVKENRLLGKVLSTPEYKISVVSNVMVNPLKDLFEHSLRSRGINASVHIGNYDNVVQDTVSCSEYSTVLVIWELGNVINGLGFAAESMTQEQRSSVVESMKSQIDLCLLNLKNVSSVFVTEFSSAIFGQPSGRISQIDEIARILNEYLQALANSNVIVLNVNKIMAHVGVSNSYDMRFFYSSKAPYTIDYLEALIARVTPAVLAYLGKAKKVLVLDCDNTLWSGVLGEDGTDGIKMSYDTGVGSIFADIQSFVGTLASQGVIICLCSKNNLVDVQDVIDHHPDMQIGNDIIAVKKINWEDKASNIKAIANELSLGLDSIVFLDDSDFEVDLVASQLPEVTVLQVPKKLHEYPNYLLNKSDLFFNSNLTSEDRSKSAIYRSQSERNTEKQKFTDIEDFLRSLEMEVSFRENASDSIERIAQLTHKTNQFNLTTVRYSDGDIRRFMTDPNYKVISVNVSDKFGAQGLVGVVILCQKNDDITIDSFLMSCRVIGRNIEYVIMDHIIGLCRESGASSIYSSYRPTLKNQQVAEFYPNCDFDVLHDDSDDKEFALLIQSYESKKINYIRLKNEI